MKYLLPLFALYFLFGCKNQEKEVTKTTSTAVWKQSYEAIGLLGDTLKSKPASIEMIKKYEAKRKALDEDPSLDNTIWVGRFIAYQGKYREAIQYYTEALEKFPDESRLLRHRGHRYISVREFEKAIDDLSKAAHLIEGKENMVEEDGLPNAQNIPVSSMHGNIYYHLGLAYYLNRDMPKALENFKKCLETSPNPDNVVSATHWIYMIQRRMGRLTAGDSYLAKITPEMTVIENTAYHQACLFYKNELTAAELYQPDSKDNPSNSAIKYAVGNWYFYNGNAEKAKLIFDDIVSGDDWASFGYIAAETDLAKPYSFR